MRPTVIQLEYLVAAARCLNFRKAAAEIHATQPALSAQIRKLETILGTQLFERDRRKVLLTEAGARVAQAAGEILARFDDLFALAREPEDGWAGSLRLGMIPTVAPHVLPKVYQRLRDEQPDLELVVREDQTHTLLKQLRDGELDLLLLAIDVELGQVETLTLFEDAFCAAMPEEHPLAGQAEVDLAEFARENLLLLSEGHCLGDQTREVCRSAGRDGPADLRASSLATLVHMVAAGQGVTMLPEMAIADFERTPGLVVRRFRAPAPARKIGLAWRPGTSRAPAFEALGALFENVGAGA